jgi:hypothetical protein
MGRIGAVFVCLFVAAALLQGLKNTSAPGGGGIRVVQTPAGTRVVPLGAELPPDAIGAAETLPGWTREVGVGAFGIPATISYNLDTQEIKTSVGAAVHLGVVDVEFRASPAAYRYFIVKAGGETRSYLLNSRLFLKLAAGLPAHEIVETKGNDLQLTFYGAGVRFGSDGTLIPESRTVTSAVADATPEHNSVGAMTSEAVFCQIIAPPHDWSRALAVPKQYVRWRMTWTAGRHIVYWVAGRQYPGEESAGIPAGSYIFFRSADDRPVAVAIKFFVAPPVADELKRPLSLPELPHGHGNIRDYK